MGRIERDHFSSNLLSFMRETFVGPPATGGSRYLDRGGGLLEVLEHVSADEASRRPAPGAPTVAGHCAHADYYVRALLGFLRGSEPSVDWPSSWGTVEVSERDWHALRSNLRAGYVECEAAIRARDTWDDDSISDGLGILVHTAYHLGSIRQALRVIRQ